MIGEKISKLQKMESKLTAVQRLAKQFENLAAAQTRTEVKPMKCNWWLENGEEAPNKSEDNADERFV